MIQAVSGARVGVFPNIIKAKGFLHSRLLVPIRPLHSYTRFEHIIGIPVPDGGIPVFKLRILDNLIDNLIAAKEQVPTGEELRRIKPGKVDSLINIMSSKARFGGLYPETGMLIDLVA